MRSRDFFPIEMTKKGTREAVAFGLIHEIIDREASHIPVEKVSIFDILQAHEIRQVVSMSAIGYQSMIGGKPITDVDSVGHAVLKDPATHQLWQMYRWRKLDRRIYEVATPLAESLADTKLSAPSSCVNLPLPTFYVAFDEDCGIKFFNELTGWHDADGVFVTSCDVAGLPVIHFLAVGRSHSRADPSDNALFNFMLPVDEVGIEEHFSANLDVYRSNLKENCEAVLKIIRIVVGMTLYLQSGTTDVHEHGNSVPASLRKTAEKLGKKQGAKWLKERFERVRWLRVGGSYAKPQKPVGEDGKQLTSAVLVAGHFRNQAHGVGRLERKILWIQPHWRGPDWLRDSERPSIVKVR